MSPLPFLTKSSLFSIKQKRKLPKQANLEYEEEIAAGFINEEDISREFTIESILRPTKDSISLYNAKKRQSVKETIKDTIANNINMIDLYSRIVFPSLFILFNVIYWTFYTYNRDVWIWTIFLCLLFQDSSVLEESERPIFWKSSCKINLQEIYFKYHTYFSYLILLFLNI